MQQRFTTVEHAEEEVASPRVSTGTVTAATPNAELISGEETGAQKRGLTTREPGNALETLLATHRKQSRRHALLGNAAFVLGGGFLIFGLCAAFAAISSLVQFHHLPPVTIDFSPTAWGMQVFSETGRVTVSGLTPLLLLIGALLCAWRVKQGRIRLAAQLTEHDDVRVVGPLIEALYMCDRRISKMVTPPLVRLLPQLHAETAHYVSENQRLLLRLYLGRSKRNLLWGDDALSLAIIESYASLGDGMELPTMRRLAAGKGCIGANGEVQQMARAYLEAIKHVSEREQQAQTLLRGSGARRVAADALLRPAAPNPKTVSEQLLRSTASENPCE